MWWSGRWHEGRGDEVLDDVDPFTKKRRDEIVDRLVHESGSKHERLRYPF